MRIFPLIPMLLLLGCYEAPIDTSGPDVIGEALVPLVQPPTPTTEHTPSVEPSELIVETTKIRPAATAIEKLKEVKSSAYYLMRVYYKEFPEVRPAIEKALKGSGVVTYDEWKPIRTRVHEIQKEQRKIETLNVLTEERRRLQNTVD